MDRDGSVPEDGSVPDTFSGKLHLRQWKTGSSGECCVFPMGSSLGIPNG